MANQIRIGTRESQLAVWQATLVKELLAQNGHDSELVYIKSDGDTDLKTPLYEIGVQGIFTRALDIALLGGEIDIAVHSMKDVPTVMAAGIVKAAVLPRASSKDILVPRQDVAFLNDHTTPSLIATSSIRRKAQWLNRYPNDRIENLRGNVNTRMRKVAESDWQGAIFAAAGLERIGLRPENAVDLDWMLPAPAQGAIIVVCRGGDDYALNACLPLHHEETDLCTQMERDFLRGLMGGCSTPISAFAQMVAGKLEFEGNILSADGRQKRSIKRSVNPEDALCAGLDAAKELLQSGGQEILDSLTK